jgi:hypothetical protein
MIISTNPLNGKSMNFPQDPDDNVRIDAIIEEKLFDEQFAFRNYDEDDYQYNYEMMPYLSPDDNPDDLEGVL